MGALGHHSARVSRIVVSWATLYCGVRAAPFGGFSCYGTQSLGMQASVVAAHGLSHYGLWALERGL